MHEYWMTNNTTLISENNNILNGLIEIQPRLLLQVLGRPGTTQFLHKLTYNSQPSSPISPLRSSSTHSLSEVSFATGVQQVSKTMSGYIHRIIVSGFPRSTVIQSQKLASKKIKIFLEPQQTNQLINYLYQLMHTHHHAVILYRVSQIEK